MRWLRRGWRVWEAWGWVESHVGRVLLLGSAAVLVVAAGGTVLTWLSGWDAPLIYLMGISSLAIGIWAAAGLTFIAKEARRPILSPAAAAPVAEPPVRKVKEEPSKLARVRITPVWAKDRAAVRVENEGPEVNLALRVLRIDDDSSPPDFPYRTVWGGYKLERSESIFAPALLKKYVPSNQTTLGIGEVQETKLCEIVPQRPKGAQFSWLGGGGFTYAEIRNSSMEIELTCESTPKLSTPWHETYIISFDSQSNIKSMSLKPKDLPARQAAGMSGSPNGEGR